MIKIKLPVNILKIIYGVAVVTENGSWASKHAAKVAEKTSLVAQKVAELAQNASYYAEKGAEKIKNFNEKIEQKARETKEQVKQAIRKEEFIEINQKIIQGSEEFNPQLVEKTDVELDDWVILEKE